MTDPFVVPVDPTQLKPGKVPRATGCSLRDWGALVERKGGTFPAAARTRFIGEAEVRQHDRPGDLWMVLHGIVFDCTQFAQFHPGGEAMLHLAAGRDGTALYDHYHRWVQLDVLLAPFAVGRFKPDAAPVATAAAVADEAPTAEGAPVPDGTSAEPESSSPPQA